LNSNRLYKIIRNTKHQRQINYKWTTSLSYFINLMYSNIRYIYTSALAKINSRMMRLQIQECVNSKGILFTIYRHRTQPVRNYNHAPHKSLQQRLKHLWTATFGITCRQLQPKLFLPAGPSATKHGPNSLLLPQPVQGAVCVTLLCTTKIWNQNLP
jgi:hypothetical protein